MTGQDLEVTGNQAVLPPRPNLGPEPWAEPPDVIFVALVTILALAACGVGIVLLRRKRRPRADAASSPLPYRPLSAPTDAVAFSARFRDLLAARRSIQAHTMTNEELVADPVVAGSLTGELTQQVARLLMVADSEKFSAAGRSDQSNAACADLWNSVCAHFEEAR